MYCLFDINLKFNLICDFQINDVLFFRYDDALTLYDRIIREDETNSTARKRKVAVYRAQGRIPDAIKELCAYLNK